MPLFRSFLQAGFECSTHLNSSRKRLDVIASTRHDTFVGEDYTRLLDLNIRTVREGARWHLIESKPGVYDFTSLARLYDAAQHMGIEIILDCFHFGWPDFVDVLSTSFISRFERFVRRVARFLRARGLENSFVVPMNEISYFAWAGGQLGRMNPFLLERGGELKRQLVRAAIAGSQVLRCEMPSVRLIAAEPVIHIVGRPSVPGDSANASLFREAMFEAWDMLTGRRCPELGGKPECIDVIGVNFYEGNQWVHLDRVLRRGEPEYRRFSEILKEVWSRYTTPIFVSETGTEDTTRPPWLHYVCAEVRTALGSGIPVEGVCWYPILNHPGWDDDRHCCNGLYDYADEHGNREIYQPLREAMRLEQQSYLEIGIAAPHSGFEFPKHTVPAFQPTEESLRLTTPLKLRSGSPST